MTIRRRTVMVGGGAAFLRTAAPGAAFLPTAAPGAEAAADELAAAFSADGETVKVIRVFTQNGRAAIEDAVLPADPSPYPLFRQFLTHKASATALYRAPPGLGIAARAVTARELVFIAAGDTTITAGQQSRRCAAGAFILTEIGAASDERAGPNGYTAIKIRLAD